MSETEQRKLLRDMGVSRAYASEIVSGTREPSLRLALRIFNETGLRFGRLKGRTKRDIGTLTVLMSEAAQ